MLKQLNSITKTVPSSFAGVKSEERNVKGEGRAFTNVKTKMDKKK